MNEIVIILMTAAVTSVIILGVIYMVWNYFYYNWGTYYTNQLTNIISKFEPSYATSPSYTPTVGFFEATFNPPTQ